MSDIDPEQEGDTPFIDDDDNDNAHQACYVFRPFPIDDIEAQQPAKKRRKTKDDPEEQLHYPLPLLNGGAEPPDFAQIRHDIFVETWDRKHARINKIIERADESAWTDISQFIKAPSRREPGKLETGLIVSGPDGGSQTRFLERWRKKTGRSDDDDDDDGGGEEGRETTFIQLRASHCVNLQNTLKNIIRSTISMHVGLDGYQDFLNKHKRWVPMNFDLELLQIFVEQNDIRKIVLSMLDIETFDMGILSELLLMLSLWSESIPFNVLLNLATTVDLFESRLPKSVIEVLSATIFTLPSSSHVLQQIVDDVVQDSEQKFVFGPLTISALDDMMQIQGISIEIFTSAIKYIITSHFFANSLSVLVSDSKTIGPDKSLCEAIRHTKSFQRHCETMLAQNKANAKEVTKLITDDQALISLSREAVHVGLSMPSITDAGEYPFLNEAYLINSRQLLNAFNPRPRFVLERALGQPGDYLSCDCGQSSVAVSSSHGIPPPSTTLYTLLQEAGTVINVRDLHDAFCARCFPTPISGDQDESTVDNSDRGRLSTFYSSLAELKMLGLVKSSTSAIIKKRALASSGIEANVTARGKDKYGDVDFVAKTGWAGL